MSVYPKFVTFDRPLKSAAVVQGKGSLFTAKEIEALEKAAFARGLEHAQAVHSKQLAAQQSEFASLATGVLSKVGQAENAAVGELTKIIPALIRDISERLLAGYKPSAEVVSRICEESIAGLSAETDEVEMNLAAHDLELLRQHAPEWFTRAGSTGKLRMNADHSLKPGDCVIKSRFGLIDARLETKMRALNTAVAAAA